MRQSFKLSGLIILLAQLVWGQYSSLPTASNNVATKAGNWLKIGTSIRANGMGGAMAASASSVADLMYNPAGIAHLHGSEVYLSKTNYLAGIAFNVIAFGKQISPRDYFAFNLFMLNSGEIGVNDLHYPDGTGEHYSYKTYAFRSAYAHSVRQNLKVGLDVNYLREEVFTTYTQTLALDLGMLYRTPVLGTVIGVSVSNLAPKIQFHGEGLETVVPDTVSPDERLVRQTVKFDLPVVVRLGIKNELVGPNSSFVKMESQQLSFAADLVQSNDYSFYGNAGFEYVFNGLACLRAGYILGHDTARLGVGGGIQLTMGRFGFRTDYAFVDYGILKPVHQISITLNY